MPIAASRSTSGASAGAGGLSFISLAIVPKKAATSMAST